MRALADSIDPAGRFRAIVALARFTGRRVTAICELRLPDVLLTFERVREALASAGLDENLADHYPHGAIRWSSETDKEGFLFITPISPGAREAIENYLRCSRRLGDVPLFPAPSDPAKRSVDLASRAGSVG